MGHRQVLAREDFETRRCAEPGCSCDDERMLYLHARCHVDYPVAVKVDKQAGTVIVECGVCERLVCEIEIASRPKGGES